MKHLLCCLLFFTACTAQTAAPYRDKQKVLWQKLEAQIQDVDQHLDGVMGVAIEDLNTGEHFLSERGRSFRPSQLH